VLVLCLGFVLITPIVTGSPRVAWAGTLLNARFGSSSGEGPVVASGMALSGSRSFAATEVALEAKLAGRSSGSSAPQSVAPVRAAATAAPTRRQTTAPVPPPGAGSGLRAIYAVFGNSPGLTWALRVAKCESGYNPLAVNRSSGASGLFQFMPSTWNANFPGWNIWDPVAQSKAALRFYNQGRTNAWTCK
jgi:soluble lytic murein transglycosylase-like protein